MAWLTAERKTYLQVLLACYLAWFVLFEAVGLYAATLPTHDLTTALDRRIPLIPSFVWAYELCYLTPVLPLFLVRDWHKLNRALVAFGLASLSAFVVYLVYPVAFPRPELGPGIAETILALEYRLDFQPGANKLPSLHVAVAWIIYFSCRRQRLSRLGDTALLGLVIAISASTLFVKQHILVDVVGGILWALLGWTLAGWIYGRRIGDTTLIPGPEALRSIYGMVIPALLGFGAVVLATLLVRDVGWL